MTHFTSVFIVFVCILLVHTSIQAQVTIGLQPDITPVVAEPLPVELPSKRQIPLMFHRMASSPPSIVSRNQRYLFVDETLMDPKTSIAEELAWCRQAGAVAICQEGGIEPYIQAAQDSGLKLILLLNMSPMRLAKWDAKPEDADSIARYFLAMLDYTKRWPNAIYRMDERSVLWLFAATDQPADFYRQVRQQIRQAGFDPIILYQAQYLAHHQTLADVQAYLEVFDGALIWGGGYDATRQMVELVVPARDKVEQQNNQKKYVVLTAKPGHWRPEKGSLIDKHGTSELRKTIDLAYQHDLDGLNIESWNDYSETHHIQPSVLNSTVLADLCVYYGMIGQRQSATFESPGLYVSHPRDLVTGQVLACELLHLPVKDDAQLSVELILRDEQGALVYQSPVQIFKATDARAVTFNVPTAHLSLVKTLAPSLIINGQEKPTRSFCNLNPGRMSMPCTTHVAMSKVYEPTSIEFAMDGHQPGQTYFSDKPRLVRMRIDGQLPLARIEIMKNDMPVYSLGFDQAMRQLHPDGDYHIAGFYWNMPGPFRKESMNFGGTIDLKGGRILDAIHVKQSLPARLSETKAGWDLQNNSIRPHDAVELIFSGDDVTFEVNMPKQTKPFTVRWKDVLKEGCVERRLQPHSRLLIKPMSGPCGHPRPLNLKSYLGQTQLGTLNDMPFNRYFLRLITTDGRIFNTLPIEVITEPSLQRHQIETWDQVANQRAPLNTWAAQISDVKWSFEQQRRLQSDENGHGFELELGGMFERDGRFNPNQVPEFVPGKRGMALRFDGNDVAMVKPQLIPLGAWRLSMWIQPQSVGGEQNQVLWKTYESIQIAMRPDGTIEAWFGDRQASVKLHGKTALKNGQWYHLEFSYDLSHARLSLDEQVEDQQQVQGFRERITQRTSIGGAIEVAHMSPSQNGFHGLIDEVCLSQDMMQKK